MNSIKNKNYHHNDSFFKQAMLNPKVAREFFETYLPSEILDIADLNTLKVEKDSFIDNALGEGRVDVLFSVQIDNEKGFIYTLVEQQTISDHFMPFRLFKYMMRICDSHLIKNPKDKYLPLIYPLIFYTGCAQYSAPRDFWSLFENPELARKFYIEPFQVVDVHKIEDIELRKKIWAGVMQLFMKHVMKKDILPFVIGVKTLLQQIAIENVGYIEDILWYTVNKADSLKAEEVIETFINLVPTNSREGIMTIAERLQEIAEARGIEKGIEKGIKKGRLEGIELGIGKGVLLTAKNLLKEGFEVKVIAKITGLPESEIDNLKSTLLKTH